MPGISRSGISISAGLFAGRDRESAARFSFSTSAPSRSTWTYTLEPIPDGTRVTETMRKDGDQPGPIRAMQRLAGVRDRQAHLAAGMTTTLERLAASAEKEF